MSAISGQPASAELRLPPFFPRAPKSCKAEADAFLSCFSSRAVFEDGKVRARGTCFVERALCPGGCLERAPAAGAT